MTSAKTETTHARFHVTRNRRVGINHIIWNPRPRFAYSLYNFYGATMATKDSLILSIPIVKPYRSKSPVLGQISTVLKIKSEFDIFITPKRRIPAWFHIFELQHVKIRQRVWRVGDDKKATELKTALNGNGLACLRASPCWHGTDNGTDRWKHNAPLQDMLRIARGHDNEKVNI